MSRKAREFILGELRLAPGRKKPEGKKPLSGLLKSGDEGTAGLREKFCEEVRARAGTVFFHDRKKNMGETLAEICRQHGIKTMISDRCSRLAEFGLPGAGRDAGLDIADLDDFPAGSGLREAVFNWADAGLTGADYAVAESGTIVAASAPDRARLISLAPAIHIAVVSESRIVQIYEQAAEKLFTGSGIAAHAVFITGPSMTADIQGVPFRGMHGPQKLMVVLA